MPEVVVSIGSNIDRTANIGKALDFLEQQFDNLLLSSIYESASVTEKKYYYNLVASFSTSNSLEQLNTTLKNIEHQCGRDRTCEDVAIDIDLLLYDDVVNELLPHRDIVSKAYVLRPLSELLPLQKHPKDHQTFQQLWEAFNGAREMRAVDFVWRSQLISAAPASMPL